MDILGSLTQCPLLLPGPAPDVAHHQPRMDPQAHGEAHPLRQARIALSQGVEHPQPGPHGPLGIIFVRQGVPKVDEQAIPEILAICPSKRVITLALVS
jgi:hypothetical protein